MPFEDFWIVDEENDCVAFRKKGKYEDGISGSETAFLNVWRAHFNIHAADLKAFTMQTLDSDNRAKLLYLLSVLRHFSIQ